MERSNNNNTKEQGIGPTSLVHLSPDLSSPPDRLSRVKVVGQELEIGLTQGFPWIWIGHDQVSNRLRNMRNIEHDSWS